jgi:hypothetical protein
LFFDKGVGGLLEDRVGAVEEVGLFFGDLGEAGRELRELGSETLVFGGELEDKGRITDGDR